MKRLFTFIYPLLQGLGRPLSIPISIQKFPVKPCNTWIHWLIWLWLRVCVWELYIHCESRNLPTDFAECYGPHHMKLPPNLWVRNAKAIQIEFFWTTSQLSKISLLPPLFVSTKKLEDLWLPGQSWSTPTVDRQPMVNRSLVRHLWTRKKNDEVSCGTKKCDILKSAKFYQNTFNNKPPEKKNNKKLKLIPSIYQPFGGTLRPHYFFQASRITNRLGRRQGLGERTPFQGWTYAMGMACESYPPWN